MHAPEPGLLDRTPRAPTSAPSLAIEPPDSSNKQESALRFLLRYCLFSLAAWVPFLGWFAAFKPGIMSGDSLGSWWQARNGELRDDITPSYTALMKLSQMVTGSPSALTLGQQLLLASSFIAVCMALVRLGARRWVVIAAASGLLVTPMVGAFSVSLWKDVPYSAALLFCGAAVLWLTARRNEGARTMEQLRGPLVLLLIGTCAAVALRQNGVFFTGFLGLILIFSLPGIRRALSVGVAANVMLLLLLKTVVYPIGGVSPAPEKLKFASFLHDIAAVVHHEPAAFDGKHQRTLESLGPLSSMDRAYSCYTVNPLYYGANLNYSALTENPAALRAAWFHALREEPKTILGHRLCAASVAWRPMAVNRNVSALYTVSAGIDPNEAGLATTPLSSALNRWGVSVIKQINDPGREWYLWRAPTWIYAAYVSLTVAALRRRSALVLLPGAVLMASQLGASVVNPAQDARYMMRGLMLAVLLLPVATIRRQTPQGGESNLHADTAEPSEEPDNCPLVSLATTGER